MELAKHFTGRMYEECVREILCTFTYIYFKVIEWPIIWEISIHHLKLRMTSSYVMHECIKIYIHNYVIHRTGLHITHAAYEARTHIGNSFEAINV
jgi:hypothetical protein